MTEWLSRKWKSTNETQVSSLNKWTVWLFYQDREG